MSNQRRKKNSGFTLIELIVVIAIIGILVAIAVPRFANLFTGAKLTADQATVRALNTSTQMFRLSALTEDPFENVDSTSDTLMGNLVDDGYLGEKVSPQTEEAEFEWLVEEETWRLMFEDSFYTITLENFIEWGELDPGIYEYFGLTGLYNGDSKDIVIPASIGDEEILAIYHDVFKGVGLVAVTFAEDSQLTRIHREAFMNNNLTSVDFPDTVTRIDGNAFSGNKLTDINLPPNLTLIEDHAFKNNQLTEINLPSTLTEIQSYAFEGNKNLSKITIGNGVAIGTKAFDTTTTTENFKAAYEGGGAGTYVLADGSWVKQ